MMPFQHLGCNNDDKYPNLECIESDYKNSDCGASKLDHLMNSKLVTIDANDGIGFEQIIKLEKKDKNGKKSKHVHANAYEE